MFMRKNSVAAALASVFFGAASAQAAPVTYSDFASWSGAVSNTTTVVIPEPSSADGFDYFGTGDGLAVYGGVKFSTSAALSNGNFFNIGPATPADPPVLSPVLSSQTQVPGSLILANILITLTGQVNGFALNFGTFDGSAVTFLLSNGDQFTLNSLGGSYAVPDFFGITDQTPFNSVLVTATDEALNLNNVSFDAPVSAIPEPSTWAMMMLGFAGIGLLGYRQSRRRTAVGA
jgi:hypothetical protein